MRLILCGGGDGEQVKESYALFASQVDGGKVLYIPIAWNHGDCAECIDWFRQEMSPYGITNISFVTDANQITKELLDTVQGVFIGGGNTFKLLKMLKDTTAFDNLNNYVKNNGLIMGCSAGALIFGQSIDTCLLDDLNINSNDKNEVCLIDTKGFNSIGGYSLFVHYKRKNEQLQATGLKVQRLIADGHKIICLPEETSIWVVDNKMQVIGQKPAEVFVSKNGKVYDPQDIIDIN